MRGRRSRSGRGRSGEPGSALGRARGRTSWYEGKLVYIGGTAAVVLLGGWLLAELLGVGLPWSGVTYYVHIADPAGIEEGSVVTYKEIEIGEVRGVEPGPSGVLLEVRLRDGLEKNLVRTDAEWGPNFTLNPLGRRSLELKSPGRAEQAPNRHSFNAAPPSWVLRNAPYLLVGLVLLLLLLFLGRPILKIIASFFPG